MMKEKVDEEQGQGLAEMLDKNLDEWLAAREEKPYTEGWKEDNWEEVSILFFLPTVFSAVIHRNSC